MSVDIDRVRIIERRSAWGQRESRGVDLWFVVDGLDRHASAAAVKHAVSQHADDNPYLWTVYPTWGGTAVWLNKAFGWERRVSAVAGSLEQTGHADVRITIPPLPVLGLPEPELPHPTAFLAHRMDPPITSGPFNQWGMPIYRWGVPAAATTDLVHDAARWVVTEDDRCEVEGVVPVPATGRDAAELLGLTVGSDRQRTRISAVSEPGPQLHRSVTINTWGQSAWTDVDPTRTPMDVAEDLSRLLTRNAPVLDVGAVHPTFHGYGIDAWDRVSAALWMMNRHLWTSYVTDAFAIQLLTTEQLEHATDLSSWQVSEVAPDRWLVRAHDLTPWFDVPDALSVRRHDFPTPELRDQARADFGQMVLTPATVKANPRPTP